MKGGAWADIVEGTIKTGSQHTAVLLTGTYHSWHKHEAHKQLANTQLTSPQLANTQLTSPQLANTPLTSPQLFLTDTSHLHLPPTCTSAHAHAGSLGLLPLTMFNYGKLHLSIVTAILRIRQRAMLVAGSSMGNVPVSKYTTKPF